LKIGLVIDGRKNMNQLFMLNIMKDFINPLKPYWLELSVMVGLLFFLMLLGVCEVIRKSGRPGWGGFVPFYNIYLLFDIAYRKGWRCLLLLVPIYNIYVLLIFPFDLAKKFNHKKVFGLFLLLFPFGGYPVLGFDDKKCVDPLPRKKKVVREKPTQTVSEPALQISEPNLETASPIASEMPSPLDVFESEEMPKTDEAIPEIRIDTFGKDKDSQVTVENSASIFDLESTSFKALKDSFDSSIKSIETTSESVARIDSDALKTKLNTPVEVEDSSSIFDLESPSFRILKDSFDASLKDIENREEFKIEKREVSVPKESVSLFGKTVTALLKNSMENSLRLVDASISREEPVTVKNIVVQEEPPISKTVGMNQESIPVSEPMVEENTGMNNTLVDELATIDAMFDQKEEEESTKTEIKEKPISMGEESDILSSEISLIDSILS